MVAIHCIETSQRPQRNLTNSAVDAFDNDDAGSLRGR